MHYSQFEYTDALDSYREALAIHERRDDPLATATTLVSTGNVQFVEGDFAGAVADYSRSRALFLKGGDKRGETRALEGLGRSFAAQGDFAGALVAYAAVLEEGRIEHDRAMQGTALSNMGDVHFRMSNLDTARGMFDQSRTHFESTNDLPNVGRAWQAMALTDLASSRFELYVQKEGVAAALGFDAVSGKTYTVQFCDDLDDGGWQKLRDVTGSSGAVTVNDPSPFVNGRFYRLVTPSQP